MLRTPVFAVFLSLTACVSTTPCPADTVEDPVLGCVPADGGTVDGCEATTFYRDSDGDGHGDLADSIEACGAPLGYVALGDDCDDTTSMRYPGLTELCDALDNDCVGEADETFDCVQNAPSSCTTTCGTIGMGSCSAACTLPPAACTPPAETCDSADNDCDGAFDERLRSVGPERNIGTAPGRIVTLPFGADSVVFVNRSSVGIIGQPLDATGSPMGAPVTVTTTRTEEFDAWWTGSQYVVAWLATDGIHASVYGPDLTSPSPSNVNISTGVSGITVASTSRALRIVATPTDLLVVFVDTTPVLRGFHCGLPALSGCRRFILSDEDALYEVEMTVDPAGDRAYLAYVSAPPGSPPGSSAYSVKIDSIQMDGYPEGPAVRLGAGNNPHHPVPHVSVGPGGTPTVAVTWFEDPAGSTNDQLRMAFFDVADFALVVRETVTIESPYAAPPAEVSGTRLAPVAVGSAGRQWFVAYLEAASGSASSASLAEITLPLEGGVTQATTAVTSGASENRTLAVTGTSDGNSLLVAASRADGMGRAFLFGCR